MKKNRYILLVAAALALLAVALYLTSSRSTFRRSLSDFAVSDTSNVTMIFMADKNNNEVKLTRQPDGKWTVNDKYPAQKINVNMLLSTILELQVKYPVPVSAHNNIIRQLASNAVKVEIYQQVYRIRLFGIHLFRHQKRTRVYYVGSATQDNRGTYMLMEHSDEPFVVFLPGLRGFVSPRYSPIEKYWRDYVVFRKDPREIASVTVDYPYYPDSSFMVRVEKGRKPVVILLKTNTPVTGFDTLKVWGFLTAFRNLNYESLLNDIDRHYRDSIVASKPFCIVTLKDTAGNVSTVRTFFKRADPGSEEIYGKVVPYDLDRLYALVNNGQDFTLIQYFVFDKIFRTGAWFTRSRPAR